MTIRNLLYIFAFILVFNCSAPDKGIYRTYPVGKILDDSLLKEAKQIYFDNDFVVLLVGEKTADFNKDYYLLFFNKNKKLKSLCYLTNHGIESINDKNISFYNSTPYKENVKTKVKDLPDGYSLNLIEENKLGGASRNRKVIENITFVSQDKIKLIFSAGEKNFYRNVSELMSSTLEQDSLLLNINDMYRDSKSLYTKSMNELNKVVLDDHYIFKSREQRLIFDSLLIDYCLLARDD